MTNPEYGLVLCSGRLTVGAGLGYRDVEFDAFGAPRERRLLERLTEKVLPCVGARAERGVSR